MKKNLSDYVVALGVLLCSAALLAALTIALTGWRTKKAARTLEIDFPDITGVKIHSEVRYAGAPAGNVTSVRLLTAEERMAAPEAKRRNAVRVAVSLFDDVPELPVDVKASLASDTLLSEKFVALSAGSPDAARLANGALLQGTSAGTFDDLINSLGPVLRGVEDTLASLDPLMKKATDTVDTLKVGIADIVPRVGHVADSAKTAASAAESLLKRAEKLIAENEGTVKADLEELKGALVKLQDALKNVDGFVSNTDKSLESRMQELSVVLQNLKVATTHAKAFTKTIGERPSKLIFGGKANELPDERAILRSNKPLPTR